MNPLVLEALVKGGVEAQKEFTQYINELESQIKELRDLEIADYQIIINDLQSELDMIKEMYNDDLSMEKKEELIDKMDNLNNKLSIEIAKKTEMIKKEKENVEEKKENAIQLATEILTGIIPFTTFARAIAKIKKEK